MRKLDKSEREQLNRELSELLERVEGWLEVPMIVLAFVWLGLIVAELVWGVSPLLQITLQVIWGLFVLDFLVRLLVAPKKGVFLKKNVLTILSLVLPAVRIVRVVWVVRLLRVTRGLRLVKIVGSLNRGMRALGATMQRRGAQYVIALTFLTLFVGAAGMYAFESDVTAGEQGFANYGEALWWTAMLLTTVGSEYWPQTAEGRILCLILSLFSLAILGYITATLATFFIGRDAENQSAEVAGQKTIDELKADLNAMRVTLDRLLGQRNEPM